MTEHLVSILMTSYNRERYIGQAIESVLASTWKNFELIIVDDCSKDNTVTIANGYALQDPRIKVIVNERNLGDYPNRNNAATFARGKYIKYVDSDDFLYPNGLEIMVKAMEAFPEAGFGVSSLEPQKDKPYPFMLDSKEAYEHHFFKAKLFHKGPLAVIMKRDAYLEMNGFSNGRMISDTDMWHRMALYHPVVLMQDGIIWQRRHEEQELSNEDEFIFQREKIKWKYLLDNHCKLSAQQINTIRRGQIKTYIKFSFSLFFKFQFRKAFTYVQCLWYVLLLKT